MKDKQHIRFKCPACGKPMKEYKTEEIARELFGCKMHEGKWGVWITVENRKIVGKPIKRRG